MQDFYVLLMSDSLGTYMPKHFAETFNLESWNIKLNEEDLASILNPDDEYYNDVWCSILDNAYFIDENKNEWTLFHDGDLWAYSADLHRKAMDDFYQDWIEQIEQSGDDYSELILDHMIYDKEGFFRYAPVFRHFAGIPEAIKDQFFDDLQGGTIPFHCEYEERSNPFVRSESMDTVYVWPVGGQHETEVPEDLLLHWMDGENLENVCDTLTFSHDGQYAYMNADYDVVLLKVDLEYLRQYFQEKMEGRQHETEETE